MVEARSGAPRRRPPAPAGGGPRLPLLVVAIVGVAGSLACGGDAGPGPWVAEDGLRWRTLAAPGSGPEGFTSLSSRDTGVDFVNEFGEASLLDNDALANGSGVALGDFDGDGLTDVYLLGVERPNALYRNLGGWRFDDVTEGAGVALSGSVSRGAAWADADGDGDLDLIVTRHSEPNVYFRNRGDGTFEDASSSAGFEAALASHSLALADTDGDGDLDLYITNYKDRWARDTFSPEERSLERVVGRDGDRWFIRPGYEDHYRLVRTEEGWQRREFGEPDEFYANDGGRFVRVPFAGGPFVDAAGRPLERDPDEWGLAVRFADLDLDGDPDLYVCNDIHSPDQVWINEGGRFRAIDSLAIRRTSESSMAVDVSDVDRDGWPDIFVAEMLSPDPVRRKTQVPQLPFDPERPGEVGTRPQVKQNTLQINRGDGTFAEAALAAGVAASGWSWGALFLDVDLDGYEDLLVTNGNALDLLDGDAQARTARMNAGDDWRRLRLQFPRLDLENRAYRNLGDGTFEDAGAAWRFPVEADISQGIAAGDLDGDGDLDVVVNRLGLPALVLRNDAPAPRLAVELAGSGPNTGGVGARVSVSFDGLPTQTAELAAGGLYLSDSADLLSFAARAAGAGTLVVDWPDGRRSVIEEVEAGRLYEVAQADAAARAAGSSVEEAAPSGPTWFEDVSATIGHRHAEQIFDEFARQPTLPLRLAQLGPGVAWIDDDADGDSDLWIGTGRGGRIARVENLGGRLASEPVERGGPARGDVTSLIPAPPGWGDALAGQMSYEAGGPAEGLALPAVLALRGGTSSAAVPGAPGSTGPLASADIDGDGDLDLFVGARAVPTAYPLAPSSRLLRNEGGRFVEDPADAGLVRGLASAAVFSDVDGDGDPDLLVATDWGPIRLYENRGGRFAEATAEAGFADLPGRWNGIATGDLNEDGRPDVVATAWGDNTMAELDGAGREILHGDLDRNGVYDVIELERGPGGEPRPVLRLDQLIGALPFLASVTPDHRAYAAADLETLLPPRTLGSAGRAEARELRHMVWLSGEEGFRPVPLPRPAQVAPAFGVAVADIDGDGHEDVVLAQNFFANRLSLPRYDAGRGLVLRGDGEGGLEAVAGQQTGFLVYGDGRGLALADYDLDRRVDIAVAQNGSATRLFRNRRAAPGIRVRLRGPASNPRGIGAAVRLEYEEGLGPPRELQAGSGYWSQNELAPILGAAATPRAVRVRWPGGEETRVPLDPEQTEVEVAMPGGRP